MKNHVRMTLSVVAVSLAFSAGASAKNWYPIDAESTLPDFAPDGKKTDIVYIPLLKAEKNWKICASLPHLKDAYWLGVNYGLTEQAKEEGVKLNVVDAGGYTELSKQISQIEDCVAGGAQAVVISAISYDGLSNLVAEIAKKGIPVIDAVNGISSPAVTAKSMVSFYTMGYETGTYLAKKHPASSAMVKVGWFPGPAGAGWVEDANKGFMEAVKGSAVQVLNPKFGDTGKEVQLKLVEDLLQAEPDVRYIVGTAVTAEAAQGLIRERGLTGKVDLLAFYMSPGVYTGIKRGSILASPADSMVIQGRMAIDQAVRALEGKDLVKHVGPKIFVVDRSNIEQVDPTNILPPTGFKPVFRVN